MKSAVKIILIISGSLFLFLAFLGIFLPLLPTTPFLLLASACYVRSSDRLYEWLINNKLFGTYIRNYTEGRGIPLRGKIIGVGVLWASLLFSIYSFENYLIEIVLFLLGVSISVVILRMKTLREYA